MRPHQNANGLISSKGETKKKVDGDEPFLYNYIIDAGHGVPVKAREEEKMSIIAQRIIRSKGTKVAHLTGGTFLLDNVQELMLKSVKTRKVYVYLDNDGNEGTVRSGRRMRRVDLHVRNTVSNGVKQIPLF